MVVYLDDDICAMGGNYKATAEQNSLGIQNDLTRAGFVTNAAKCKWDASQQCSWLGFNGDLSLGMVSVPPEKLQHCGPS